MEFVVSYNFGIGFFIFLHQTLHSEIMQFKWCHHLALASFRAFMFVKNWFSVFDSSHHNVISFGIILLENLLQTYAPTMQPICVMLKK